MEIKSERLLGNLRALKEFTDTPGQGVTRFSYGGQDAGAREYIIERARAAGCTVRTDDIGNIRIGLGTNVPGRPVILCGSHVDTVRNGGWLDGVYGVCGALEVMETLADAVSADEASADAENVALAGAGDMTSENAGDAAPVGAEGPVSPSLNYEMVIFAEEEGSNFGSTMTGSKFITGKYGDADLDRLTDDTGRTLRQVLAGAAAVGNSEDVDDTDNADKAADPAVDSGGAEGCSSSDTPTEGIPRLTVPWDLSDVAAMLELHIEQGPVLERAGLPIGIVDSIFGMRVIEVTLQGVGNHAGATPMKERYDALCAASECILAAERIVTSDPEERTVVTVGKVEIQPNCSNVIPQTVRFSLEVRDRDEEEIDGNMERIIHDIRRIAQDRGVKCGIREHSRSSPLHLSEQMREKIRSAAEEAGIPYRIMDSGAVHDACMIAEAGVPTGMIFVPSKGGRSHVPEEDTDEKDLITGVRLLLDVVTRLRTWG